MIRSRSALVVVWMESLVTFAAAVTHIRVTSEPSSTVIHTLVIPLAG